VEQQILEIVVSVSYSYAALFRKVVDTHKNSIRKVDAHYGPYPPPVFHVPIHFLETK